MKDAGGIESIFLSFVTNRLLNPFSASNELI